MQAACQSDADSCLEAAVFDVIWGVAATGLTIAKCCDRDLPLKHSECLNSLKCLVANLGFGGEAATRVRYSRQADGLIKGLKIKRVEMRNDAKYPLTLDGYENGSRLGSAAK